MMETGSWREQLTLVGTDDDKGALCWINTQVLVNMAVALVVALVVVVDLVQV